MVKVFLSPAVKYLSPDLDRKARAKAHSCKAQPFIAYWNDGHQIAHSLPLRSGNSINMKVKQILLLIYWSVVKDDTTDKCNIKEYIYIYIIRHHHEILNSELKAERCDHSENQMLSKITTTSSSPITVSK